MERTIRQVRFPVPIQPRLLNVAAYARVSSGKDAMLHSLSAQVSFYSELIQNHEGWRYCGVFSDEAFTGTKESRPGFQSLMAECRAGRIDLVLTKSISRFSRNTVTTLQTVRDLRDLGVDVFFEKENIHTMSADGELMMTILASYARRKAVLPVRIKSGVCGRLLKTGSWLICGSCTATEFPSTALRSIPMQPQ